MNRFSIRKTGETIYDNEEYTCFIDELSIQEWSNNIAKESDDKYAKEMGFLSLVFALNNIVGGKGDVRFISELFKMESAIIPVLVCEDDLDLCCIVIVIEAEKKDNKIYWKRIGYVNHCRENYEEEKACGILYTEAYTKEDWKKYGDNIALEKANSPAWEKWISENWDEEVFRRNMNYTLPYYRTEGNIVWLKNVDLTFDRSQYDKAINEYATHILKI